MTGPVTQRLWVPFQAGGSADFMVMPDDRVSYRRAKEGIGRFLAAFDAAGLGVGDRVVIRTDRDDVAAIGFLAAVLDGVIPVALEGTCPDARLGAIIGAVEPGLVFSDGPVSALGQQVPVRQFVPDNMRSGLSILKRQSKTAEFGLEEAPATRPPRLPSGDGLAYLMFTSGTTSEPTGVQISRNNLRANLDTMTHLFGYDGTSRIFNDLILAHADGMIQGPLLAAWNTGAVLRAGGFEVGDVEAWLWQVRQMRATHVITVPTVWSMIDHYAAHDDYFDAPECKWLMSVADKMPMALMQRLESRFSRPVASHYGLTETVASALYSSSDGVLGDIGTLGQPVDCEARIADDAQEGELQLRGDNIFAGYWRNAARTTQSFTADGWFRTGDLARKRPHGSFEMLGRLKSVIMTGGLLIRPDEIDEALQQHAAVLQCATVGVPDKMFGEIAVSAVILTTEISEEDLTAHLRARLEPRKVPKRVFSLPSLPSGPSGKPNLTDLKQRLGDLINANQIADPEPQTAHKADLSGAILAIAAEVFRVPIASLSPQSQPDAVPGWDSFTHINLILSVEQRLGLRLTMAQVSAVRKIEDLIAAAEAAV